MFAVPTVQEISFYHKLGLLACTLFPLYYISYHVHPIYGILSRGNRDGVGGITTPFQTTPSDFQSLWLQTTLLQPFDPAPVRAYCKKTKWHPNLIYNLPNANGGVGNVRAEILDFLFYAIEAGAGIIVPGMARRSEEVLFDVWGAGRANFETMFDREWFEESLKDACPGLKLYDAADDAIVLNGRKVEEVYWPEHPSARRHTTREKWVQEMNAWLEARNVDDGQVTIVDVERTMWQVDTRNTPPGFRVNMPQVLRVNPDIRQYAGAAMAELARRFQWDFPSPLVPTDRLHLGAFYGAHLRTEADTISALWQVPCTEFECGLDWTAQTDAYIQHAERKKLNILYTASGNATEIARFKVKAAARREPLAVVDKWDLLTEQQAEELKALHWDQQALVDLEILLRCSVFGGMAKSSFAFMIVTARNAWMEEHGYVMDPWSAKQLDPTVVFEDQLQKIWGRNELNEDRVPKGAWP
jgi:hypothetical protein